jgi:hypothetical protein
MWELKEPRPVKLIAGILACDERCLTVAKDSLASAIGEADLVSNVWVFTQTDYYVSEIGPDVLRQFVSFSQLIHPGELADVKHRTNAVEQDMARTLGAPFPRPVNLDPGIIEPAKLVLASTKNYAHRIYIGKQMYAEVTLVFSKGAWRLMPYTYPDYQRQEYFGFFSQVRDRLVEQLRTVNRKRK